MFTGPRHNSNSLGMWGAYGGAGSYYQGEIIVDCSIKPQTGKVVVASLDGESTDKRAHIENASQG